MSNKASRYLLASQLCLFVALTICYVMMPRFLYQGRGVSNYGVHYQTVVLYSLGFGLCAVFLALAARSATSAESWASVRNALYTLAVLYGLVLLSTYPYKLNDFLGNLHTAVGTVLFGYQLFFAGYLAVRTRRWPVIALLIVQAGASLVLLITLIMPTTLLFAAQLVAGLAFAALLVVAVPALLYEASSEAELEIARDE